MKRHTILSIVPFVTFLVLLGSLAGPAEAQELFVGLEDANLQTRSSDLAGFPVVTWSDHFAFEVNGATATPDGDLYLCNGPFTTRLYRSSLDGPPVLVSTVSVDIHGLGFGNGTLYGFANYASPMGIYEIVPSTGQATLKVSTAGPGYRFFGLDFNAADGLLYGYTEYGAAGLYSIDPDSGVMTRVVGVPPGVGGQGRALAVGNQTVYLLSTRGDDGEPCFAYDLAQGPNGTWTPFTNPYPNHHNTGGAAWIASPTGVDGSHAGASLLHPRFESIGPNPTVGSAELVYSLPQPGPVRLEVYNLFGSRVALLLNGEQGAGRHSIRWDGRAQDGRVLPSGLYLARIQAGGAGENARIMLIR